MVEEAEWNVAVPRSPGPQVPHSRAAAWRLRHRQRSLHRVFQDLFLPNLAIFVLGLGAALFWLRTGMVRRGMMLMALLVTAADIALVARFVNENRGLSFVAALVALQVCALGSSGWLLFKLSRRRWGADSRQRDQLLNAAFKHYLRDELRPAGDLFRRLRAAEKI